MIINKLTKRVFKAIMRQKDLYFSWPSIEKRASICQDSMNELMFCIGYLDGTEVKLAEKPLYDSESYFGHGYKPASRMQQIKDPVFSLWLPHALLLSAIVTIPTMDAN